MKGFKPFSLLGLTLILCALLMTACGGKTPANGPSPLNILNSSPLPTGAEGDPYSQNLQATGGLPPYTWNLDSGAMPPGFTFSSGGVLSGTPPPGSAGTGTTGMQYGFTVRVTDTQSPVKAYNTQTYSLTINPPLSFTASTLAKGIVGSAYSATVGPASGGISCNPNTPPPPPYNYALAPGSGPLPAGLTLNADGTITGTPTGPTGSFPFTVQATDCFPTTATANFSITVTGKIQGNYAFSFNGYNQQGQAFFMAGSFVADGSGNITSGVFDRNGSDAIGVMTAVPIIPGTGSSAQCPISSTATGSVYCVGRSGETNGGNLGTIVIASSLGTYSFSVSVSLMTDSRIILADPNNPGAWGSGVLKTQGSLSGVTLASSNFAFGLFGVDGSGNRYGGAGFFITDANGNISSTSCATPPCGVADLNDNGTVQSQVALTGSVSSVDSATGRGTATFSIGSNTFDYAFYVVPLSAGRVGNQLAAVQTDPVSNGVPLTVASIAQRPQVAGGGFSNLSLNATRGNATNGAVFELNAVANSAGTDVPDISLGLGNFDGQGNITSYVFDENNGGVLTTPSQNNYTGTYSVDSTNLQSGRVTVNLGGVSNQPVWYLVTFNTGFVIGTDPAVTSGTFGPQVLSQPILITNFAGRFYGGTSNPVLPSVTNEVEEALALPPPSGPGALTATYDSNGTGGVMMNQMLSGTYCIADGNACPNPQQPSSATGRLLILDSNGNPADILYVVTANSAGVTTSSGTKSVTLSTGANPSLSVLVH